MNNPKRILHVVGAMNRAGTETMLMNIYRSIDRNKIQFDFISYSQEDAHYDQEIKELGGRVFKLYKTTSISELVNIIKTFGPYEAVHSHTLFHCGIANIAATIAGVKTRIAHAHTTLDRSDSLIRKLYIATMRRIICSFSTHLLACSNQAGSYLFGKQRLEKNNYKYFPNLIDYRPFLRIDSVKVNKLRSDLSLGNRVVIGHIGRFIEAKNHSFLLLILKSLLEKNNEVILLLVGDGDLRRDIELRAKQLGILEHIRFTGVQSDIPTILHCMDVFVFPSIYEGLGLVLLEAQASGLPCIVSEAIQPEADLNLGLMRRLSLTDEVSEWAEIILKVATSKENDRNIIMNGFKNNGYEMNEGISKLRDIYFI